MRRKIKSGFGKVTIILLLLSFIGCSAPDSKTSEEAEGNKKESATGVAKGSLDADSVIISVGKTKVTYREYQVYSYLLQSKYEAILDSNIWEYSIKQDQTSGMYRTLGTEAIEEIIRLIIQLKVIEKEAVNQHVVLTTDEKEQISFDADKYFDEIPDVDKKKYDLTPEMFKMVLESNVLARMMYDIVTGSVDVNISEEEEKISKIQMICFMLKGTDKDNQEINVDAAGKTALFDEASKIQRKASKGSNFYALAEKYSSISQIDFEFGLEDEPKEVAEEALAMKGGEISNVISTEDGYYILRCISNSDQDAVKAHREALILERQTKAFQKSYESWAEKYAVRVSESILERELFE